MIPLRHFSSDTHKKPRDHTEKIDTPKEIVKRIQELCNRGLN